MDISFSFLLECILLVPLLGAFLILFIPEKYGKLVILNISLILTISICFFNLFL
jgi:hypothetical protein